MSESFSIRQEGGRVLILKNGVLLADMPWQAAERFARALHVKAKAAEELANAERIIGDQALLIRAGAPFGLTSRPSMVRAAIQEAFNSRLLRRYLPGGVRSTEAFGAPRVIQRRRK